MASALIKSYWSGGNLHFKQRITGGSAYVQFDDVPLVNTQRGTTYCVDSVNGLDTYNGLTWSTPFLTITKAVATCSAGDTILLRGSGSSTSSTTNGAASFVEAVSCSKSGVSFIGIGPTSNEAIWSAAADGVCLTLTGTDCLVQNIRFRPPAWGSGTPAAISLSGAYQTVIDHCRFQGKTGSWYGILTDGNNANVKIINNEFAYINTATYGTAIKGAGYTVGENSGWIVSGNNFQSNLNHIVCRMRQSFITGNYFAAGGLAANNADSATLTVLGIDIHGATGGCNIVTQNYLGSLYHQACYYGGTNDDWCGNWVSDRTHTSEVDATTGISKAAPSA